MYPLPEIMELKCPLFSVSSFMAFIGDRMVGIRDRDVIEFTVNGYKCRGEDCPMIGWATMRAKGFDFMTHPSKQHALFQLTQDANAKLYYYCGLKGVK